MHVRIVNEDDRRLVVMICGRRNGRIQYLGMLGSLRLPLDMAGRARFWQQLPERFSSIDANHPGRVTPDDKVQAIARIETRIPPTEQAAKVRLQILSSIQRDARAAIDQLDDTEVALEEAARQLLRLAKAMRWPKRTSGPRRYPSDQMKIAAFPARKAAIQRGEKPTLEMLPDSKLSKAGSSTRQVRERRDDNSKRSH